MLNCQVSELSGKKTRSISASRWIACLSITIWNTENGGSASLISRHNLPGGRVFDVPDWNLVQFDW